MTATVVTTSAALPKKKSISQLDTRRILADDTPGIPRGVNVIQPRSLGSVKPVLVRGH